MSAEELIKEEISFLEQCPKNCPHTDIHTVIDGLKQLQAELIKTNHESRATRDEPSEFTKKCRHPRSNPQAFGKLTWREVLFEACDIIDTDKKQLKKYGRHLEDCPATKIFHIDEHSWIPKTINGECNCGFEQALKG